MTTDQLYALLFELTRGHENKAIKMIKSREMEHG